jgi:predicted Ser/Thr protein kinase
MDLIRTPYLRSWQQEQTIYDRHIVPHVRRHVAPYATLMAAMFASFTRMRKPNPDRYTRQLGAAISTLTAVEKAELYATGVTPDRLDPDAQKLLHANIKELYLESDSYPIYEGRVGASPREMRVAILDAAQSVKYKCLSPLAVIDEIEALCQRRNEFEWLQQDSIVGGYHDVKVFREYVATRLLTMWEDEFYAASGLVEETRYADLFDRYVQHVSVWVKKERLYNRVTRQYEEPDEKLMAEVERLLDVRGDAQDWRRQMISGIAAWALDHPGEKLDTQRVFPSYVKRMREAIFADRRQAVARMARDVIILVREEGVGLEPAARRDAESLVASLIKRNFCSNCAADAASTLVRRRFADLL